MKLNEIKIAQKLIGEGFSSSDIDSEKLYQRVLELLGEYDFFNNLYDEMIIIEDNNQPMPQNFWEYLEKVGRF